jgi:AcrR family transcriptional regulator
MDLEFRPPSQRRSEATVVAVREAASRLLRTREFGQIAIAEIAREAGIGVGTLYRYYPSKEALLLDLRERMLERVTGEVTATFAMPMVHREDLLARMEQLLTVWVRHSVTHRRLERAVLAASCASEAFAEEIRRQERMVRQVGVALLTANRDRLRPLDPDAAAHVIYTLLEAAVTRAMRYADVADQYDDLIRETVRMVGHYLIPDRAQG